MSDTDSGGRDVNRGRGIGGTRASARQSLGGGRTKTVLVEKKRKRIMSPGGGAASSAATLRRAEPNADAPVKKAQTDETTSENIPPTSAPEERPRKAGIKPNMLRSLSNEEYTRRIEALRQAKKEEEAHKLSEAEDIEKRERRNREREARESIEKANREAEDRHHAAEPALEDTGGDVKKATTAAPRPTPVAAEPGPLPARDDEENRGGRRTAHQTPSKRQQPNRGRGGDNRRRSGKLTIAQATGDADGGRQRSIAAMRRRQEREKRKTADAIEREKVVREVKLPEAITVQELANRMSERVANVVKALMNNGIMATRNQPIDADTAELLIEEFGHKANRVSDADVEDAIEANEDRKEDMLPRAPVITIMGHVDHGKTSLLDALRQTSVATGEAGGITQHIGAYQIISSSGVKLTFLDTPGHAAFTSMRARGVQVTDIVVLVVAADDSVMPQTVEAIQHTKAAKVPMIVAINKIDRPAADPMEVRTGLLQHEVVVEKMSGDVLDVEVSAVTRQGLDDLIENIVLQAELLELKANPNRPAEGTVIEAKLDVGRGPVATVLIQRGTLRAGDIFVAGEQWGRVRALINDKGERVREAGPSVPVEVLGLSGTPEAGDVLNVIEDESKAREISEYRRRVNREKIMASGSKTTLDQLLSKANADEDAAKLHIVIKSDVQGSAEAISQALEKIGNEEVQIHVLLSGVGAITESDVTLADASKAPIIGFNVRANAPARESANQKGVEIRYYSVIYDLVNDVRAAASGLLSPEIRETFIGYAGIKQIFKVTGVGKVAGCEVTEGVARRSAGVRLLRDNTVVHEGTLKTLKRFKDEVKEVQAGQECGMAFENYDDIREGDVIEIFTREDIERTL